MTTRLEFSSSLIGEFAVVICAGLFAPFIFALFVGRLAGFNNPRLTSFLEGSARHYTYITLAVAERIYGAEGLAYATLTVVLLAPVTNIAIATSMVTLLRGKEAGRPTGAIARDLTRNTFLLSIAAGLTVNFTGLGQIPVLNELADILGAAALPIVLLCVVANIRVWEMAISARPIGLAILGKLVVFPLVIVETAFGIGMDTTQALVSVIFGGVPTAASSFSLARAMGGDAPAMAAIATIETAVTFLTLPRTLMLEAIVLRG